MTSGGAQLNSCTSASTGSEKGRGRGAGGNGSGQTFAITVVLWVLLLEFSNTPLTLIGLLVPALRCGLFF